MAQAISFIDTVAVEVGVNEAIMLSNIYHWVMSNKASDRNCFDNKYWTYDTVKSFSFKYPFWTAKQVRTILSHLEKNGYIESGCYNKMKFDRTKWYTLTDKGFTLFNMNSFDLPTMANEICPFGQMRIAPEGKPIPHTNTYTNTNTICAKGTTRKKKEFVPPTLEDIQAYIYEKVEAGKVEYKNVDVNTFFNYYNEADWHMSNGRKIKSWKQCLVTWASREWNKSKEKQPQIDNRPDIPYVSDLMARDEGMYP